MNANEIQVGAEVLVARYSHRWSYMPAKVVRTTKTWIVVKREHEGASEEAFRKSDLRQVGGVSGGYSWETVKLIIDPVKIQEAVERKAKEDARKNLETSAIGVLNKLNMSIRGKSDEVLQKIIELGSLIG